MNRRRFLSRLAGILGVAAFGARTILPRRGLVLPLTQADIEQIRAQVERDALPVFEVVPPGQVLQVGPVEYLGDLPIWHDLFEVPVRTSIRWPRTA
mgnify:CR=1 FL=1